MDPHRTGDGNANSPVPYYAGDHFGDLTGLLAANHDCFLLCPTRLPKFKVLKIQARGDICDKTAHFFQQYFIKAFSQNSRGPARKKSVSATAFAS